MIGALPGVALCTLVLILIGRSELLVRDRVDGDRPFHGILSYGVRHVDDVPHGCGGAFWGVGTTP